MKTKFKISILTISTLLTTTMLIPIVISCSAKNINNEQIDQN